MIETDLIDYLQTQLTGVSFALDQAANSTPPFIEFTVLSAPKTRTTKQTSSLHKTEIEAECWASSAVAATALCEQMLNAIRDYRGLMGNYYIYSTNIYNEFSGHSQDKLHYRNTTINFSYKQR